MKCDELKAIKIELNNHGKPIASIQGTTSYYGISPNDTFYPQDKADEAIAEKDEEIYNIKYSRDEWAKACNQKDTEIAELKAENAQLMKEMKFMHSNCKWHVGDGCYRLLGEKLAIIDDNVKLKQKLEDAKAMAYAESVDAGMENRKLQDELTKLKALMPEYKQFIEDEDFKKKLVNEYAGYVYEWAGHRYVATPYINVFIKGILRTLYKALANWADAVAFNETEGIGYDNSVAERWRKMKRKCREKAEEYR